MHRLPEKFLAILLTLLLGMSPLQGGMHNMVSSPGQKENVHQMPDKHTDSMVMAADNELKKDCDQCHMGDGCADQTYSFTHCASCVLAVLTDYLSPTRYTSTPTPRHQMAYNEFLSQPSASLFRPPRV